MNVEPFPSSGSDPRMRSISGLEIQPQRSNGSWNICPAVIGSDSTRTGNPPPGNPFAISMNALEILSFESPFHPQPWVMY